MLDDISRRITPVAMRSALGASSAELEALEAGGILWPKTALAEARMRWHAEDATALLAELASFTQSDLPDVDDGWVQIQIAQARLGVSVGEIIAAVRDRRLPLRRSERHTGYRAFLVPVQAVKDLAHREGTAVSGSETFRAGQSLAEFGRSIGFRDIEKLVSLAEAGQLEAEWVLNPVTRREQWRLTDSSMRIFTARFITLTMIGAEFGMQRNTARALLKAHGFTPFIHAGQRYEGLFDQAVVRPIVREATKQGIGTSQVS